MSVTHAAVFDRSTSSSTALIRRAQQLRALADTLEARAEGTRFSEDDGPTPTWVDVFYGDWRAARREAERRLSGSMDSRDSPTAHVVVAVTSALLGDAEWSRIAAARAEAMSAGDTTTSYGIAVARAVCCISAGDPRLAAEILVDGARPIPSPSSVDLGAAILLGLLAETCARTDRAADPRRLVLRSTADGPGANAVRRELELAAAFLAEDRAASMLRYVGTPEPTPSFALGRAHLWVGTVLRRERAKLRARYHLQLAADHLAENGRAHWSAVASRELRATGVHVERGSDDLTEQQTTIARLAGLGLSNREIGDRLFLSPRTVGSHLYRIFPKLGVTSRHQLSPAGTGRHDLPSITAEDRS